jgi:hypothetical protein
MFKIIKDLLEAGKIDKEAAEAIDKEVSKELKTLRDEAASYRTKHKEAVSALEEVKTSKEQLEEKLKGIDEQIAKAKEEGKSELVSQLEAQKAESEKLKESLAAIEASNRKLRAQNALIDALGEYDVIDREVVSAVLERHVAVDDDGVKYKNGETVLPIADGLKQFFEAKPHLLKPKGVPGSGSGSGGNGGVTKKWHEMTATERAELYKADPMPTTDSKKKQECNPWQEPVCRT